MPTMMGNLVGQNTNANYKSLGVRFVNQSANNVTSSMRVSMKTIEPGMKVRCINVSPRIPNGKGPTGIFVGGVYTVKSIGESADEGIVVYWLVETQNSLRNVSGIKQANIEAILSIRPELEDIGYWAGRFVPYDGMEEFMKKLMEPVDFDVDLPEDVRELETINVS